MPNFDQTGPAGQGRMSGQGRGICGGNQPSNFGGRRRCCQRGQGSGRFSQNEKTTLSLDDQEKNLEKRLEEIRIAKKQLNTNNNA